MPLHPNELRAFLDQARSTKSQAKNTPRPHFQLTTSFMENNITLQNE
jgi:hypothetical protein